MGRLGRCLHAKYFASRRGTTLHELPSVFIIITAEITDPTMATNAGVTFAPRLKDAILAYGKPGVIRRVRERVYKFPDERPRRMLGPVSLPCGVTAPLLCGSCRGRFDPDWVDARQEAQRLTVSHAEESTGTGTGCAAGGLHIDIANLRAGSYATTE
jgi:hypothetical protein